MIGDYYYGTGRRKSSVARVFLKKGSGRMVVNGKPLDKNYITYKDIADGGVMRLVMGPEPNKERGTGILISQSTLEACGDAFVVEALGKVSVRGRTDTVAVFSIDPHRQDKTS